MKQDEPISPDELRRNAYEYGYENPIQLNADGWPHADAMPTVRSFAGNEDSGYGTYTQSREIDIISFEGRESESVETIQSEDLVEEVSEAMATGTRDKIEGRDPDSDRGL